MSLSSSLFTGTSGLKNMGNGMQVVGNNIANINTVGFKGGGTTFADTLYETVTTNAGTSQMGRGMAVGTVTQDFTQGSFESTGNTTDLSIGGDGFFIVRQEGTDNDYYTRAGNFYFDKDGSFVNPEGYIVQGWELDPESGEDIGSIGDLILSEFTSAPDQTSEMTVITNLDADSTSQSVVLSNNWDSSADIYIDSGAYEYTTVVQVYDSLGSTHDVSIYYDKLSGTEWEYIITMNPDEDNRNLVQTTDSKGLLARGTITFSESSGDILDMTMEEFTGLLGNFQANGVNGVDDISYEIEDYTVISADGYGFSLEYDGSSWDFADTDGDGFADLPDNYPNATIVESSSTTIEIALTNTDLDPDIKIQLAQAAVATDSLGFDINDPVSLHTQGIEGLTYDGDTENDNTSLEINDPSIMTHDSTGVGIIWNPEAETWYWSNPETANSAGTLVTDINFTTTGGVSSTLAASSMATVINASTMDMYVDDIKLRVDERTGEWDWNMELKEEDFTHTYTFDPTNDPNVTITAGTNGAMATADTAGTQTTVTLSWDGSSWTATNGGGQTQISVDATSDEGQVQITLWEDDGVATSAGASTVLYTFGSDLSTGSSGTIEFTIDPTPPEEYPNAGAISNTTGATATSIVGIDFDGDSTVDLEFLPTAGGAATAGGQLFTFDTDPDTPPENYASATLSGDQTEAVIDLDGSGNDDDSDDIKFTFETDLTYGSTTDPYDDRSVINFDIVGSTAWTNIDKSEISSVGYYSFTADFLGGEFGTTEQSIQLDFGSQYDGTNFVNDSLSTTQYSKSSSTTYQDADGYAAGDLESVDVSSDGTITGIYSNGELIPLFRVGLAKFYNNYGLDNEGGNLFSETRASGTAITNRPGENGLGTIAPNSLEMSNVDVSEEFVKMIEIQRGFQGNSKTITTVDEMMETVINMKR